MSNVLRGLGFSYFQMPEEVVLDSALMAELYGGPLSLYVLIMALAQKTSKVTVELTAAEIQAAGVSKNYVTAAAQKLNDLGLVRLTRSKGVKWSFLFEILDPKTRLPLTPLHIRKDELSADKLKREQATNYFIHRLGENFVGFTDNGIEAVCPFHNRANHTSKRTPTLSIKLPAGIGSCTWRCFDEGCDHHGGGSIIDFEIATQRKAGRPINSPTAWERISFIIRAVQREEDSTQMAVKQTFDLMGTAEEPDEEEDIQADASEADRFPNPGFGLPN
jgi:hypothetical protein